MIYIQEPDQATPYLSQYDTLDLSFDLSFDSIYTPKKHSNAPSSLEKLHFKTQQAAPKPSVSRATRWECLAAMGL